MKDLQVNDRVYTGSDTKGNAVYQSVYSFGHLHHSVPTEYIQISHTKQGKALSIELSKEHLIFLAGQKDPVRAETVQKGDKLVLKSSTTRTEEHATVTKLKIVSRNGAYLPLTADGTIVVNGVAASVYGSVQSRYPSELVAKMVGIVPEQTLYNLYNAPYRMVCMGVSSKLCKVGYDKDGIILYHSFLIKLADVAKRYGAVTQVLILVVGCAMLFPFVVAESIFGPRFGMIGLLVLIVVFGRLKAAKKDANHSEEGKAVKVE